MLIFWLPAIRELILPSRQYSSIPHRGNLFMAIKKYQLV